MASSNLQIADISATQDQKEVTANAQTESLDLAMNSGTSLAVTAGDNALTTTQTRENTVLELTGTPGAAVAVQMPDTNARLMAIYNNSDDVVTVENSASAGAGTPILAVGQVSIFHYDGTDFLDLTSLAASAATLLDLTDTPSAYTGTGGMTAQVNAAETAIEFVARSNKDAVVAATIAAGTLASDFENADVVDGVTLATGDRILIKDQASGGENGIYTVEATGAPTRAIDFDDDADAVEGTLVPVLGGTINAQTQWMMTNTGAITVGTTATTWALSSGSSMATIQTTGATITDIATIALASGEAKAVRGFLIATEPSTANSLAVNFFAAGKNNAGTSAELAAEVVSTLDGASGLWTFDIDVDDTTDTIRFRATGVLATTINWTVRYEVITET